LLHFYAIGVDREAPTPFSQSKVIGTGRQVVLPGSSTVIIILG
jgi:hypothetical protein